MCLNGVTVYFFLCLEDTVRHVTVERADRTTDCMDIIIEIHRDIPIQADNLVLVIRSVERRIPRKLSFQIAGADGYFKTFVAHLARINLGDIDVRISGGDRHYHVDKHIVRVLDVCIETQIDAAVD